MNSFETALLTGVVDTIKQKVELVCLGRTMNGALLNVADSVIQGALEQARRAHSYSQLLKDVDFTPSFANFGISLNYVYKGERVSWVREEDGSSEFRPLEGEKIEVSSLLEKIKILETGYEAPELSREEYQKLFRLLTAAEEILKVTKDNCVARVIRDRINQYERARQ